MKIKPEDRSKLIGLLAAISIMFLYLIFVVVPSLSGAQPAPAVQDTPIAAPPLSPAPAVSKSSPAMMDAGPVPDAKQDPFLSPAPNAAVPAPAPSPMTAATKPITPTVTAPLAIAPGILPIAPKTLQPPLTLLGVAGGGESVAVFQVGESTLEKKKGDALPGGFRLRTIDGEGVTLSNLKSKAVYRLEVGRVTTETGSAN